MLSRLILVVIAVASLSGCQSLDPTGIYGNVRIPSPATNSYALPGASSKTPYYAPTNSTAPATPTRSPSLSPGGWTSNSTVSTDVERMDRVASVSAGSMSETLPMSSGENAIRTVGWDEGPVNDSARVGSAVSGGDASILARLREGRMAVSDASGLQAPGLASTNPNAAMLPVESVDGDRSGEVGEGELVIDETVRSTLPTEAGPIGSGIVSRATPTVYPGPVATGGTSYNGYSSSTATTLPQPMALPAGQESLRWRARFRGSQ